MTDIVGEVIVEVGGKYGFAIAGVGVGVVAVPLHPVEKINIKIKTIIESKNL